MLDERRRFTLMWKGSGFVRLEIILGSMSVECDEWLYVGVPMKDINPLTEVRRGKKGEKSKI